MWWSSRRPGLLGTGSVVGVISPSSDEAGRWPRRRRRAIAFLRSCGYEVRLAANATVTGGYTAGTPQQRAADIHALFLDPSVDAVVAAIGGNNTNQLLDLIDYQLIADHPKLLIGYSDTTALLTAVWQKAGPGAVMGPQLLPQFGEFGGCLPYTMENWRRVLENAGPAGRVEPSPTWTDEFLSWDTDDDRPRRLLPATGPTACRPGAARGPLYGANVETLLRLAGTPYWPSLDGCVVLLEATPGTTPSQLHAQLTQLSQTGVLRSAVALGFGRFGGARGLDSPGVLDGLIAEVLRSDGFSGPVVRGLDLGHTDPMICVPYGVVAELVAEDDARVSLTYCEAAVSDRA